MGVWLTGARKRKPVEEEETSSRVETSIFRMIQYAVFFVATLATFWALFLYPYREATSFRYVGF